MYIPPSSGCRGGGSQRYYQLSIAFYLSLSILLIRLPSTSSLPYPVLGDKEIVYNWNTSHCTCNDSPNCTDPTDPDYPDTPPRVFVDIKNISHLVSSDSQSRVSLLYPNTSTFIHNCTVYVPSQQNCSTQGYNYQTWLHSPYIMPNGLDVAALIHMEYHGWQCQNESNCAISSYGDCANEAIQQFNSNDGGWTWYPADPDRSGAPNNLVVVSPYTYEYARDNFNKSEFGFGDPTTIFMGQKNTPEEGYYYVYVSASNPDIGLNNYTGLQQRGQCLLRTTNPLDMSLWRAWNGSNFSVIFQDPYTHNIGSNVSNYVCEVINTPFILVSVGWSSYFNGYIASGFGSYTYPNGTRIPCCGAWLYSVTNDLLNWPQPQLVRPNIQEGPGVANWEYDASFLDPNGGNEGTPVRNWHEVIGQDAWLYYWQAQAPEGRNVMRQSIHFP